MPQLVDRAVCGAVLVVTVGIALGCDQSAGVSNDGEPGLETASDEWDIDTHLPLPELALPPETLSVDREELVDDEEFKRVVLRASRGRASRGWDLTIGELAQLYIVRAQGDADREFELGHRYSLGYYMPQNDHEAARWFRSAAERGHVEAQVELGLRWRTGRGVPENAAEAARWFRSAAEPRVPPTSRPDAEATGTPAGVVAVRLDHVARGHPVAQFELGVLYAAGVGVDRDDHEAARWFRLAAEQGHAGAQLELGRFYANGTGVDRDDHEAVEWLRRAAEQGHPEAQLELRTLTGPR